MSVEYADATGLDSHCASEHRDQRPDKQYVAPAGAEYLIDDIGKAENSESASELQPMYQAPGCALYPFIDGQKRTGRSEGMGATRMRCTRRAARTALISSTAVAATLLSTLVPAQAATASPATPVPPPPSSALAGTWVNTNHATKSTVDIVVTTSRKGITVDGFGACTPTPCEFGRIAGTVFGPNVSATIGTSFAAQWDFKFKRTVLLATYSTPKKVPTLTVHEFNTFTDDSGRADYTVTERFHKGRAVKVTKTGVSASDYPLGSPVSPAVSLPAIWINTATTGSVQAVILSLGSGSGLLQVHAYGFCSPVPCNWGTVTGITFGPSVVATTGGTFLAPYAFSFANKLLDGRINAAGTALTVQTWTEFTDHSKRSNYVSTDTFVPLR